MTYFSVDAESNRVIVGRTQIKERSAMGEKREKTVGQTTSISTIEIKFTCFYATHVPPETTT